MANFFVLIIETQISLGTKSWRMKIKQQNSSLWLGLMSRTVKERRRNESDHDDDSMKFNLNSCIVLSRREFLHSINDFSSVIKRREGKDDFLMGISIEGKAEIGYLLGKQKAFNWVLFEPKFLRNEDNQATDSSP